MEGGTDFYPYRCSMKTTRPDIYAFFGCKGK
jgi:hypothetical protein